MEGKKQEKNHWLRDIPQVCYHHGWMLIPALMIFFGLGSGKTLAAGFPQEHDQIVETVLVGNIEIAVRVFDGDTPVKGLKKSAFQLSLGGHPLPINGFYEEQKKLGNDSKRQPFSGFAPSRLKQRIFVLIFNLSDFREDMSAQMDILFKRVIQRGDRLIVISNRHFFPEWVVTKPEETKSRVLSVLKKEVEKMRFELLRLEAELNSNAAIALSRLNAEESGKEPELILREFLNSYQNALEEIKKQYLQIPIGQYIKVAEYLRGQKAEKWALVFYQVGRLPMLKSDGRLGKFVDGLISHVDTLFQNQNTSNPSTGAFSELRQKIKTLYADFVNKLRETNDYLVNDTGKAFLNSGAVFHIMLMKPVQPGFSEEYKYESVSTESETILKKISRLTGGKVVLSNKMIDFVNDITTAGDSVYIMTYALPPGKNKKDQELNVQLTSPKYRVIFDDQQREKSFKTMINKLIAGVKDLEINSIVHHPRKHRLMVQLDNIQLVAFEKETYGAVRARLQIKNSNNKQIVGYERTFKGIKKEGLLFVDIPKLPPDHYTVILEIRDLFSLKNIFIGDAVTIDIK